MKCFAYIFILAVVSFTSISCNNNDAIWEKLDNHESRIFNLETLCNQLNTNINSLQTIVNVINSHDYVNSIAPVFENGQIIGYTITFVKSNPVIIYNGKDGSNGSTPILSILQDNDGIYYWTVNAEWLLDAEGNKIPVTGKDGEKGEDGITPFFKIEGNKWYISYDKGASWNLLGEAVEENPPLIISINDYDSYIEIILNDETKSVLRVLKYKNEVVDMFPYEEYLHKLVSLKKTASNSYENLSLLCSTDVHGMVTQMSYYLDFYRKYSEYLDEMINLGDLLGQQYGIDTKELPYDDLENFNKVLCAIGNHDVFNYNNGATEAGKSYGNIKYWAPNDAKYDRFLKNISLWGVVSPFGVDVQASPYYKACYYYKDYPLSRIRLIVLDSMDLTSEQVSWFSGVIEEAQAQGLQVLCASHIPMGRDTGLTPFDCNWVGDHLYSYGQRDDSYLNIIDDFIANGGTFICWIHGHYHYEEIGIYTAHPQQVYIILPCTMTRDVHQDVVRLPNDSSVNNFNVISIEPYDKYIRIMKVGCKYDRNLKHRDSIVLDYGSDDKRVVSQY